MEIFLKEDEIFCIISKFEQSRTYLADLAWFLSYNFTWNNLVLTKKNEYKLKIVDEMNLTCKNLKYLWRHLDKLDSLPHDSLFKDGISGKRWVEHFKTVLREENREISYPADSVELGPLDYRIARSELNEASK